MTPAVWREELTHGRCLLILDGVDEVPETLGPHRPRRNLLSGLTDALPEWLKAGNRVLLTSRPYGLDDADRWSLNLPQAELENCLNRCKRLSSAAGTPPPIRRAPRKRPAA